MRQLRSSPHTPHSMAVTEAACSTVGCVGSSRVLNVVSPPVHHRWFLMSAAAAAAASLPAPVLCSIASWADIFKTEPPLSPLRELHDPAVSAALDGLGAVTSSAIYSVLLAYRTPLSGSISTVLTGLSWICVGTHSRRALPCPVCA